MSEKLLEVIDLNTNFYTGQGVVRAVWDVSFSLSHGKIIGIVGESGCGKSVTSLSIMRLIPYPPGKIDGGKIIFNNIDLLKIKNKEMQNIRGKEISMIFQDPMTALNPVLTVGDQISETLMVHKKISKREAVSKTIKLLELVKIPNATCRIKEYPHTLSGGMRQRVMIAIALSCNPKLLIADEPTTALDVTIQAQILALLKQLQGELNSSIILITHDLGVVAQICEEVLVMYAGSIVEKADTITLLKNPRHPYTWGLQKSIPRLDDISKKRLVPIKGQPPNMLNPPKGCRFAPRCNEAVDICKEVFPELKELTSGHIVRCHLYN